MMNLLVSVITCRWYLCLRFCICARR